MEEKINISGFLSSEAEDSIDTESSVAKSANRQKQEREMQERLEEFLKKQEAVQQEIEGESFEFSQEEESQLANLFRESELAAEESQQLVSKEDLINSEEFTKTYTINTLESAARLVPTNGEDDDVLKIVDGIPKFATGGLPAATAEGYILMVKTVGGELKWQAAPLQWNDIAQ